MRLVLASGSPRRRAALARLGVTFTVVPAPDDGPSAARDPGTRVLEHARHKARTVRATRAAPGWILAADTLVVVDGEFLTKPLDHHDAARMLRALSGRTHEVWTGVVLLDPADNEHARADAARVRFVAFPEPALAAYLAGNDWRAQAGASGLQGWAGTYATVEAGDRGTVIGLSEPAVAELLAVAGYRR
jgi:septum formation protein